MCSGLVLLTVTPQLPLTPSASNGAEEGAEKPQRRGKGRIPGKGRADPAGAAQSGGAGRQAPHVASIIHSGLEGLLPLPLTSPARVAAGMAARFAQLE